MPFLKKIYLHNPELLEILIKSQMKGLYRKIKCKERKFIKALDYDHLSLGIYFYSL